MSISDMILQAQFIATFWITHYHTININVYIRLDPTLSSTGIDTTRKSSFLEEGEAAQEYFFLVDDVGVQRPVICHHHHLTSGVLCSSR